MQKNQKKKLMSHFWYFVLPTDGWIQELTEQIYKTLMLAYSIYGQVVDLER